MNESSPAPDGNPYEPPGSNPSATLGKPERRYLRWYHWLVFFSPAMVCILSVRFGPAVEVALGLTSGAVDPGVSALFKWSICAIGLGVLLCVVIGHWFSRRDDGPYREANGCIWTICSLIVNTGIAFGGCALVFR